MLAIAQRVLQVVKDDRKHDVMITLFMPHDDDGVWKCAYEIGWPEGTRAFWAGGRDSVQAIQLAMQMIGAELYVSDQHKAGRLMFEVESSGYGFPVARTLRDLLVGDDVTNFG